MLNRLVFRLKMDYLAAKRSGPRRPFFSALNNSEVWLQLSGKSGYEFLWLVHSTLCDKMQ
jgi:predicted ATPase